ncbi:MAG: decarboxylating 6-phosphogluconate dehydrogenase [Candidatus Saccharimonadales bacterium]
MKIGIVGLGKMGAQIAERLLNCDHHVEVFDIDQVAIEKAVRLGAHENKTREELLKNLDTPAIVWLMIPSQFVQEEIDKWLALLPPKSILIDGGNSDFRLTIQRAEQAAKKDIEFIDVGTSGGILGLQNGFSMMIGGNAKAVETIDPIIKALAQLNGYHHFGPAGSGHFVKMVHNGIEYGLMEAYAEGYRLLKEGPFKDLNLAAAASVWQHGSIIGSSLNELTGQVLQENPELNEVSGYVAESGEARWTLDVAKEKEIDLPVIQAAFDVRVASQTGTVNFATKLLAAMRNRFGGHNLNK